MMRKAFAILTALSILGAQSGWAEGLLGLGKITTDGSLEVLGNSADNETDLNKNINDHRGDTITRVRVGLGFPEIAEGVSGRIEAVRNSASGGTTPVQYGGTTPAAGNSLTTEQGLIRIQNAYVDIVDFLHTDQLRLGRQYAGRKGDLLVYFGPKDDDALTVTAFDSLVVKKKVGPVDALFATGKVNENDQVPGVAGATDAADAGTPGDLNLSYLILSSDALFPSLRLPLELGYYRGTAANATAAGTTGSIDNQTLVTYDLRAGYGLMDDALNLGLEYAQNGGQQNNGSVPGNRKVKYKGSAYVLKADYANKDRGFGLKGVYANASGASQTGNFTSDKSFHDTSILSPNASASDFRYGEILSNSNTFQTAGFGGPGLDTGLRGNGLNVIGLGGNLNPSFMDSKLNFTADFYTVKANKAAGGSKKVGTEIDLAVEYRHSGAVSATAGYAMLNAGTGLANGFAPGVLRSDKVSKLFAKLSLKWGGVPEEEAMPARRPAPQPVRRAAPVRRTR